jgi:hypothetical protein
MTMRTTAFRLPDLPNLQLIAAADRYGEVSRKLRELEREKEALRELLLDSGQAVIEGRQYIVVRSESVTRTLDSGAVYALYGGQDRVPESLMRESTRTMLKATERS